MADLMTPGGWLAALEPTLDMQAASCQHYRAYYDGNHPLLFATAKWRQAFGLLYEQLRDNWMQLVVDSAVERLTVEGFRFGGDSADADAWRIWQSNNMDAASVRAFTEAVKCGRAYLLVSPGEGPDGGPLITVEHPSQMVVANAPGNPFLRTAALKRWRDPVDDFAYATLYLPDVVVKFRSQQKVKYLSGARINWMLRPDDPGGPNPLGRVPAVPLENKPDLLDGGRSDLDTAIPLQNAINKLLSDQQTASEFNAYPQRVATGLEVPLDANGNPDSSAMFKASQAHVWISESPDTKFGTLTAGDLANYTGPVDTLVHHIAAHTRTPAHYLLVKMVNMSADALRAAETGLVFRCRRKIIDFSDPLEETMRLAFLATGDTTRGSMMSAETIWRDPESQSPAVVADALIKKQQIGVPLEILWAEAGYSPQQIAQMKKLAGLPNRQLPGAVTTQVAEPGVTPGAPSSVDDGNPPE